MHGAFLMPLAPQSTPAIELRWHVLLCEPQRGHIAARRLEKSGFRVYHPTVVKKLTVSVRTSFGTQRRRKVIGVPLFPGYIFVKLNFAEGFGLENITGLRQNPFLIMDNSPATISDDDVIHIREVEGALKLSPLPYKVGDKVRFTEGPFSDQIGHIAKMDDAQRIEVLLSMLGGQARVVVGSDRIGKA
jgi:transcriptional antiterminator RfaH